MFQRQIIEKLQIHLQVFEGLLAGKSSNEYLWKPQEDKWCLLEIVCHLVDEEREDFRKRVQHTLEKPDTAPPPINPVAWVTERKYLEQDYREKVSQFMDERLVSVGWLRSLKNPNWQNAYQHPELGALSAYHFLTNWLAHDLLHIRQINALAFQYLNQSNDIDLSYAGRW
jgi:hypothetical protein